MRVATSPSHEYAGSSRYLLIRSFICCFTAWSVKFSWQKWVLFLFIYHIFCYSNLLRHKLLYIIGYKLLNLYEILLLIRCYEYNEFLWLFLEEQYSSLLQLFSALTLNDNSAHFIFIAFYLYLYIWKIVI